MSRNPAAAYRRLYALEANDDVLRIRKRKRRDAAEVERLGAVTPADQSAVIGDGYAEHGGWAELRRELKDLSFPDACIDAQEVLPARQQQLYARVKSKHCGR